MSYWRTALAATLSLGAVGFGVINAQRTSSTGGQPAALTAFDYVQIRQLANRYAFALDTGADNGYAFADLFTADGAFDDTTGREALAALARGGRTGLLHVGHYMMNHVIEPTADGASGRQYVIVIDHDNNVPPIGNRSQWDLVGEQRGSVGRAGGHFQDLYARTPQGWRFKRRQYIRSASGMTPDEKGPLPPIRPVAPVRPDRSETEPPVPGGLSAMDYLEIERLVASYGHALDNGYGSSDNGKPYADLYTADATFGQSTGHDQLAALAREQPQGPEYVRHYLTNHVIEPFAGQAIGKQYLVVIDLPDRASGKPGTVFLGGHYEDVYARMPDGWRIRTRRLFRAQTGGDTPVTVTR